MDKNSNNHHFHLIIIGAGVAGINAAYRFQTLGPADMSYAVLESRDVIGGTWDLFRYPGIRADTDIFTFSFAWNLWPKQETLAIGSDIKEYLQRSAADHGIDQHIRFRHRVTAANWSVRRKRWELTVDSPGRRGDDDTQQRQQHFTAQFLFLATGYYDHKNPREAVIPGLRDRFQGKVIHPQFWPADYDYAGKDMVVIGSGATAVTLVPAVASQVRHVTMLQRSPSYVMTLPRRGNPFWARLLPRRAAYALSRWVWVLLGWLLLQVSARAPALILWVIRRENQRLLPADVPWDPHFNPRYEPWTQRLCISMDGDFFAALRAGKASVVTDSIDTITEHGIRLRSGRELPADVIVTATGLRICLGGKIVLTRDDDDGDDDDGTDDDKTAKKTAVISLPNRLFWHAIMLQDTPNLFFNISFDTTPWTLGCDCAAILMARVIHQVRHARCRVAYPYIDSARADAMPLRPIFTLQSTYLKEASNELPKAGTGVWAPRSNYIRDIFGAKYGDIKTDLVME